MEKKILLVVDVQNDFVTGSLGSSEAQAIIPAVKEKIKQRREAGGLIIFTRDTHGEDYLDTPEGKKLPVPHCIFGTKGWELVDGLSEDDCILDKNTFGMADIYSKISDHTDGAEIESIEIIGLCTDICVITNALIIKTSAPDVPVIVDPAACAGVTPETHEAAIKVMEMCQIDIKRGR